MNVISWNTFQSESGFRQVAMLSFEAVLQGFRRQSKIQFSQFTSFSVHIPQGKINIPFCKKTISSSR
jgi:hypothetical protein